MDSIILDGLAQKVASITHMTEDNYPENRIARMEAMVKSLEAQPNPVYEQLCDDMSFRPDLIKLVS